MIELFEKYTFPFYSPTCIGVAWFVWWREGRGILSLRKLGSTCRKENFYVSFLYFPFIFWTQKETLSLHHNFDVESLALAHHFRSCFPTKPEPLAHCSRRICTPELAFMLLAIVISQCIAFFAGITLLLSAKLELFVLGLGLKVLLYFCLKISQCLRWVMFAFWLVHWFMPVSYYVLFLFIFTSTMAFLIRK